MGPSGLEPARDYLFFRQITPAIQITCQSLLITFSYVLNTVTEQASITAVRMDFVEPDTIVNIRLEASVSHRLLAEGKHAHFTLRCDQPS